MTANELLKELKQLNDASEAVTKLMRRLTKRTSEYAQQLAHAIQEAGPLLAQLRGEMPQKAVAKAAGVSQAAVSRLEAGTLTNIEALLKLIPVYAKMELTNDHRRNPGLR